jgi:hypothetical protein
MDLHAALDHESDVLDLAPLTGVDDAWMWTGPNDRFRHAAALAADGKHSFEIRTMDSWNEEIARAVLAFAVVHSEEFLGSDSLTTPVAGFTSPVRSFDTVASISPRVTRYQHDAPELTDATVPVFPAWHFEFSENATPPEIEFLLKNPNGLQKTELERPPLPFHRIRFANSKMRTSTPGNGMHLAYRDVLAFNLKELANTDETSFVEFENRLGEVWNVVWHNGTWLVTGADDSGAEPRARTLGLDDVLAFTAVQLEK